jgi:thioredoxin 1
MMAVSAADRRQPLWRQISMAGKAVEITDANFQDTVLNSDKPVLIDFWAVWCGPCRAVAPIVEEIAEEYEGRAVVGKLDVDSNRDTATKYGIQAIPTLFLVKDGEIADKIVGNVADKNNIKAKLDALL